MNIIDNGNAYTAVQNVPSAPERAAVPTSNQQTAYRTPAQAPQDVYIHRPPDANTPRGAEEQTGRDNDGSRQARDEYVQTQDFTSGVAYNVSDVKRDRNGRVVMPSDGLINHTGKGEPEKIADILLVMGRKSLSIFRLHDNV